MMFGAASAGAAPTAITAPAAANPASTRRAKLYCIWWVLPEMNSGGRTIGLRVDARDPVDLGEADRK
jgi:hypothetical protein